MELPTIAGRKWAILQTDSGWIARLIPVQPMGGKVAAMPTEAAAATIDEAVRLAIGRNELHRQLPLMTRRS